MALSAEYCRRPALEEVINDPTVAKHYWRFRYGVRRGLKEPSKADPGRGGHQLHTSHRAMQQSKLTTLAFLAFILAFNSLQCRPPQ